MLMKKREIHLFRLIIINKQDGRQIVKFIASACHVHHRGKNISDVLRIQLSLVSLWIASTYFGIPPGGISVIFQLSSFLVLHHSCRVSRRTEVQRWSSACSCCKCTSLSVFNSRVSKKYTECVKFQDAYAAEICSAIPNI
jgi:hypothetical protein